MSISASERWRTSFSLFKSGSHTQALERRRKQQPCKALLNAPGCCESRSAQHKGDHQLPQKMEFSLSMSCKGHVKHSITKVNLLFQKKMLVPLIPIISLKFCCFLFLFRLLLSLFVWWIVCFCFCFQHLKKKY